MGNLIRIKAGVEFEYENDNYIFKDIKKYRRKKITSRLLPSLLKKNQWESVGHAILDRFSILEKEEIDPYYSVRGDIAEMLVIDYLNNLYKQIYGVKIYTKTWEKEEVNYDNFPHNPNFGGLVDIAITSPEEHRAVVEVKSKSKSKYKKIKQDGGSKEEVMQGEFLAHMANVKKYIMLYIFFSQDQENTIRDYIARDVVMGYEIESKVIALKIIRAFEWTYNLFDILIITENVNTEQMQASMAKAKEILDTFSENGTINAKLFKEDEKLYFNSILAKQQGKEIEVPIINIF